MLSLRDLTDEQYLWVSASGPASITFELAPDVVGVTMTVADGSGEVLSVNTTDRIYTMPYNYSTPLTVTLSAPELGFTQTYDVLATDLVSSVMAWNGDQYYLTGSRDPECVRKADRGKLPEPARRKSARLKRRCLGCGERKRRIALRFL